MSIFSKLTRLLKILPPWQAEVMNSLEVFFYLCAWIPIPMIIQKRKVLKRWFQYQCLYDFKSRNGKRIKEIINYDIVSVFITLNNFVFIYHRSFILII